MHNSYLMWREVHACFVLYPPFRHSRPFRHLKKFLLKFFFSHERHFEHFWWYIEIPSFNKILFAQWLKKTENKRNPTPYKI
ncbi:unnamed protein product [Rhizophagus irregularis]|nr:unnamed protein product [Rhizophagus irregularis]